MLCAACPFFVKYRIHIHVPAYKNYLMHGRFTRIVARATRWSWRVCHYYEHVPVKEKPHSIIGVNTRLSKSHLLKNYTLELRNEAWAPLAHCAGQKLFIELRDLSHGHRDKVSSLSYSKIQPYNLNMPKPIPWEKNMKPCDVWNSSFSVAICNYMQFMVVF